jgi:exonuclease SbcC
MKILGLKFKNINSLAGEWEIRFDQPPLSDARLFAIVGPNGSGKSSILDALTLALYGETARLAHPESGIMSPMAEDSYSETIFAVGDDLYRSRWSVRKVDGVLAGPEMSFFALNGGEEQLEDRVVRVRERIAEVTGLDFKRFCCSILLAQGEYTAFLNALGSERAEILERIIGPEVAQELETSIRDRASTEGERLLRLKETAESFSFPDKARQEEARREREEVEEQLRETGRSLEELREIEGWLAQLDRLEGEASNAGEELALAGERHSEARKDLAKLERAASVRDLGEDVKALEALKAELDRARLLQEDASREGRETEARIAELEERLRQGGEALEAARNRLEERRGTLQEAELRDREIREESERFLELASGLENLERLRKEKQQSQSDAERRSAEMESRLREVRAQLGKLRADADLEGDVAEIDAALIRLATIRYKFEELHSRRTQIAASEGGGGKALVRAERAVEKARSGVERLAVRIGERKELLAGLVGEDGAEACAAGVASLREKLAAYGALAKIGEKLRALNEKGDPRSDLSQAVSEEESMRRSLDRERSELHSLADEIAFRDALSRLGADRATLKSGAPCPLCGALHHPYVDAGLPDFGELNRIVREREEKISKLEGELQALQTRIDGLRLRAGAVELAEREWRTAAERIGGEWPVGALEAVREAILGAKEQIVDRRSRLRRAKWHGWRMQWLERSLRRKESKLAAKKMARDDVLSRHDGQRSELEELDGRMHSLEEEENAARLDLVEHIKRCGERAPDPGAEMDAGRRIKERRESYRSLWEEGARLEGESRSLVGLREDLERELEGLQARSVESAAQTHSAQMRLTDLKSERASVYGDLDPVREREELEGAVDRLAGERESWSAELAGLHDRAARLLEEGPLREVETQSSLESCAEAERKLSEKAAAVGVGSVEEAAKILSILPREQEIADRCSEAAETLKTAEERVAAARDALAALRAEAKTEDSLEEVRKRISTEAERHQAFQDALTEAERVLREGREAEREFRDILQAVAVQEKICAEAEAERQKIQSQDAARNRNALHRLMMERLLGQTNRHLEMLNSRYTLRLSENDELGVDMGEGSGRGEFRSIRTLSGGELFVASLCLALGLADMANKHRKMESLFLDEGFGALDDEMLYMAVKALKELRNNGKTIGVISHVKRLAEEVPTQIRVEKTADGFSEIAVVA